MHWDASCTYSKISCTALSFSHSWLRRSTMHRDTSKRRCFVLWWIAFVGRFETHSFYVSHSFSTSKQIFFHLLLTKNLKFLLSLCRVNLPLHRINPFFLFSAKNMFAKHTWISRKSRIWQNIMKSDLFVLIWTFTVFFFEQCILTIQEEREKGKLDCFESKINFRTFHHKIHRYSLNFPLTKFCRWR